MAGLLIMAIRDDIPNGEVFGTLELYAEAAEILRKRATARTPSPINVIVEVQWRIYRVAFRGSRALCCMRRCSRGGEVALNLDGPTAQAIVERARKDLINPPADG